MVQVFDLLLHLEFWVVDLGLQLLLLGLLGLLELLGLPDLADLVLERVRAPFLAVPNPDLLVLAAGDQHGLGLVELHLADVLLMRLEGI